MFVLVVWSFLVFEKGLSEQQRWHPRDSTRIKIISWRSSSKEIILGVQAKSGIKTIFKQKTNFLPWKPQHELLEFSGLGSFGDLEYISVPYPFSPNLEWGLGVQAKDGYWDSVSPYFPAKPDFSGRISFGEDLIASFAKIDLKRNLQAK